MKIYPFNYLWNAMLLIKSLIFCDKTVYFLMQGEIEKSKNANNQCQLIVRIILGLTFFSSKGQGRK
jgi:hypothetical protein